MKAKSLCDLHFRWGISVSALLTVKAVSKELTVINWCVDIFVCVKVWLYLVPSALADAPAQQ